MTQSRRVAVARREQRSLFGEILDWMLAPLLLLWPMSLGLTWLVAQGIANRPYDRELAEAVQALARQPSLRAVADAGAAPAGLRLDLERLAASLLRPEDEADTVHFQVLGPRGELLAGDARLALPETSPFDASRGPPDPATVRFRNDLLGDEPVRVAWMHLPGPEPGVAGEAAPDGSFDGGLGGSLDTTDRGLVQVAESLGKRSRLATEIIKGVLLPQFVILPLAVILVWFALARGIRPLAELQQRIRRRDSTDLSPLQVGGVPDEVAPLVGAINDLLARLDHTIAAQRHFLADAAHQLKTPLAGLRMQAELAAREIDSGRGDPAAIKHSLRQIAVSTQRAAHMVNQLLSMARADAAAGQVLHHVPVDLAGLVRSVVRDFVAKALERGIDLGYEGPDSGAPAAPVTLRGEAVLLGELVRNLVDNALQYTPRGGSVTARIVPDPFGQVVVLQVEDTGPGIPAAEREAVFRPFYRALDTQVDGSGLGLAIVQEIAQRHGASITLTDARPRHAQPQSPGALFTLRFPLAGSAAGTAAVAAGTGGGSPPHPEQG